MHRILSVLSGLGLACLLLLSWGIPGRIEAIERACDRTSTAIDVQVHGVRSDQGNIMFILYGDNPDDFLAKGKKLLKQRIPAKRGTVVFCVITPKTGVYAAAVYHDENSNGKFDKNWIGLPSEGGGFSNNPQTLIGPPRHAQAAFRVPYSQMPLEIQLSYPVASGR
ncbi:DUF2141 domain-containing protein [Candidatus Methylomirabilis sp.]|uniref:DUF2141 domain-containing protein n=1 Tax=Candidatus Methylomirabilis sp. TaxID=2032687 RepID=UPI002A68C4B5|nr:DUF2141 domain-containing protein [Candidatus Methylomirabilis sp.]